MTKNRDAFKAGIFIILSIVLIICITVMIKGLGRFNQPIALRSVSFMLTDNIGGLRVGDDVRVGGLKVGVVKSIDLIDRPDGNSTILVWFTIPSRIDLHKSAHIVVETNVTGPSDLNIDNLGSGALLASNDSLSGSPGTLANLLAAAGQVMPEVRDAVRDVRTQTVPRINTTIDTFKQTGANATDLVKALRTRLDPIIERYYGVADTARQALSEIRDVFGESKSDFKGTVRNLNEATATVNQKLPPIMDKIDSALTKAQGTVQSINEALEDVKKTVANTRDITASGRSVISGNKSKLEAMIASLKTTGDNLKAASSEIRRSPWRLLYKPGPGEVANLNLYDSARQFAEGANSLSDAATALRDALHDPNTDKARLQSLVQQLDKSFANFNEVETELWKGVKD
jgi:phospholipid/cholesterol/gamma-HCH transport system substrate-binding protein